MKYPYHVFQAENEGKAFWVAKSDALKGCVGQGDSEDDAIAELKEYETAWLEAAKEFGIAIPKERPYVSCSDGVKKGG